MKAKYIEALKGKLVSKKISSDTPLAWFNIINSSNVYLTIWWVDAFGGLVPTGRVLGPTETNKVDLCPNQYHVLRAADGAFVSLIQNEDPNQEFYIEIYDEGKKNAYRISSDLLTKPNAIGPILPSGTDQEDALVPAESAPVCVGSGIVQDKDGKENIIVRSQYWKLTRDSTTIAPQAQSVVSLCVMSGMQSTTSDEKTVSESIGINTSAGWGPISTSLSYSLSASSTHFHQVVISELTTRFETTTIKNEKDYPVTYFCWQIMDVITIVGKDTLKPVSSVVTALNPPMIQVLPVKIESTIRESIKDNRDLKNYIPIRNAIAERYRENTDIVATRLDITPVARPRALANPEDWTCHLRIEHEDGSETLGMGFLLHMPSYNGHVIVSCANHFYRESKITAKKIEVRLRNHSPFFVEAKDWHVSPEWHKNASSDLNFAFLLRPGHLAEGFGWSALNSPSMSQNSSLNRTSDLDGTPVWRLQSDNYIVDGLYSKLTNSHVPISSTLIQRLQLSIPSGKYTISLAGFPEKKFYLNAHPSVKSVRCVQVAPGPDEQFYIRDQAAVSSNTLDTNPIYSIECSNPIARGHYINITPYNQDVTWGGGSGEEIYNGFYLVKSNPSSPYSPYKIQSWYAKERMGGKKVYMRLDPNTGKVDCVDGPASLQEVEFTLAKS